MRDISCDELCKAIYRSYGNKFYICEKLKIHVRELDELLSKYSEANDYLLDEQQRLVDEAQEQLRMRCLDGDVKALTLMLSAKANKDGYGNKNSKLEITGKDGSPLVMLHTAPVLPSISEWKNMANKYLEDQNNTIDVEVEKEKEQRLLEEKNKNG